MIGPLVSGGRVLRSDSGVDDIPRDDRQSRRRHGTQRLTGGWSVPWGKWIRIEKDQVAA